MRQLTLVAALFAALTVALTWPQARHLSSHVPDYDDSLLSIWRISWISHALATAPSELLNGNIFHPEQRTLAYTDAVPLQGLVAAPFISAGVSPVKVYNLVILGSIALSGVTMWLLALQLTGSASAAVVAGIIFAFVPFRFDHYMHLELQATVFMPLALWWLERALASGRGRDVAGFAVAMVLQLFSGIYYTIFLATALAVVVPLRLWALPADRRWRIVRHLAIAIPIAALVAAPYLFVYTQNRSVVGERSIGEVYRYSATLQNYLATEQANYLHGWWSAPLGQPERRLFPGALALVLAGVGLVAAGRRGTSIIIVGVVGFVVSLGLNTPLYDALRTVVFTYRGLRAPARASILVFLAIAALAAYGWAWLLRNRPQARVLATTIVAVLLMGEYATRMESWLVLPPRPPSVYRWLAQQPRTVVLELPLPRADRLAEIPDGLFMYGSTFHWQPLLNGYSGFYPRSYLELLDKTLTFPSDEALAYLRQRGVQMLVLHGSFMTPDRFGAWAADLAARPDVRLVAEFPEQRGSDLVFTLEPQRD